MKKITLVMLIAFTITIHGQNKLLSSIQESYNNGSWEKSYGINYEYDTDNNLTTETDLNWNAVGSVWEIAGKITYSYTTNNKVTQEIIQEWNSTTNAFENRGKTSYTYTNGQVTEIIYYEWTSPNWVFKDKTVISYNANNLPNGALSYLWNGTQWVNDGRYTTTFNANQKVTEDLGEKWINLNWSNDYKTLYTYNSDNKLITVRYASWDMSDPFNNRWAENERNDYELDTNGNRTKTTTSYGGSIDKREYNYDTSSLMASFANPFKDKSGIDYFAEDYPYVNKVLGYNEFRYNTQTISFEQNGRTTYNYNSAITLSTKTNEIDSKKIAIYPNPTNATITVSEYINNLEVFDIAGKKVKAFPTPSTSFDVSNLKKGVYFLKGKTQEGKSINEKLVKE